MTTMQSVRPASTSIYAALADKCLPLIERYHADLLEHDKAAIEANPKTPFLHWTTASGTHLTFLPPEDDESFPPRGEWVKYLFGLANREHLLAEIVSTAAYHAKDKPNACVYYFDGKRLVSVDAGQALAIAKDYRKRIEREWHS